PYRGGRVPATGACSAVRGRDGGAMVAGAAPGSAAPGRGRRGSGRVAAAAPLRGGVPSAGDARDIAHAVARHPAGVPPARGARRDSRRALRGRVLGRAIRPTGSRGVAPPRAARGAPRGAGGRERLRSALVRGRVAPLVRTYLGKSRPAFTAASDPR